VDNQHEERSAECKVCVPIKSWTDSVRWKSRGGGKGTFHVDGGRVILDMAGRQFLRRPPMHVQINVALSQIVNVEIKKKILSLWIYPEDGYSAGPLHRYSFELRTVEDAHRLSVVLPVTLSPDRQQIIDDRNWFLYSMNSVTPRIFAAPVIMAINVVVFILMAVSGYSMLKPQPEDLMPWGGLFPPATLNGEWWRVLTSNYVHLGPKHIALNMLVLVYIGPLMEQLLGHSLFLLVFIASGITGSLASMHFNPEIISVGASGAIFGLYGALLGYCLRQRAHLPISVLKEFSKSGLGFIFYNVVIGLLIPFLDHAAHLGGLVGGFILGMIAAAPLDVSKRKDWRSVRLVSSLAASAAIITWGWNTLQNPYGAYFSFVDEFASSEVDANAVIEAAISELNGGLGNEELLIEKLEKESLAKWISIREAAKAVTLPENSMYSEQFEFMTQIADLRVESLLKLTAGLRLDDERFIQEFSAIHQRIESLIAEQVPGEGE